MAGEWRDCIWYCILFFLLGAVFYFRRWMRTKEQVTYQNSRTEMFKIFIVVYFASHLWNVKVSQAHQTYFGQTAFPEEPLIFVDRAFLKLSCHIFFHWMLLHYTNQPQQHSCGHGCVEHIQLQLGWTWKGLCTHSARPRNDTSWIYRYPVAESIPYKRMCMELLCWLFKNHRWEEQNKH